MKFELDSISLSVVLSALKSWNTPLALETIGSLRRQQFDQQPVVAPVVADAEDLGSETGTFDPRVLDSRNPNSSFYRPACKPRVLAAPYVPTYKQPCGYESHSWKHGSCTHYHFKDPADDGPEVDLIRSFFIFPGGAFGGFGYMKQALSDLWENWS